jgi:hypothetical protein
MPELKGLRPVKGETFLPIHNHQSKEAADGKEKNDP